MLFPTIISFPNFTDSASPVLKFRYPDEGTIEELHAYIEISSAKNIVREIDFTNKQDEVVFVFSDEEKEMIYQETKNKKTAKIYICLRIKNNGKSFTIREQRELRIIEAWPTVEISTRNVGMFTNQNGSLFVKGYNTLRANAFCTPKKGAEIKSITFRCGGEVKTADVANPVVLFYNVHSDSVEVSVEDTRGYITTELARIDIIDYFKPTINLSAKINSNGVATLSIDGVFKVFKWDNEDNKPFVKMKYRIKGEETFSQLVKYSCNVSEDKYFCSIDIEGLDHEKTYEFYAYAFDLCSDLTGSTLPAIYVATAVPVCDWGADDFNFNRKVLAPEFLIKKEDGTTCDASGEHIAEDNYGLIKLPNGTMIQYNYAVIQAGQNSTAVTFDIPFVSEPHIQCTPFYYDGGAGRQYMSVWGISRNGFSGYIQEETNTNQNKRGFYWMAIGRWK